MQDYFAALLTATTEECPKDVERKFDTEEALRFQNECLTGVNGKAGQEKVWNANAKAGGDASKHEVEVGKVLMEMHLKILEKYGFEATEKGAVLSAAAFTDECHNHPPIAVKREFVQYLLNPEAQKEHQENSNKKVPFGVSDRRRKNCNPLDWDEKDEKAKLWLAVGGKSSGGVTVRKEMSLGSALLSQKLQTGALVEQINKKGDRLKYELVSGDGPDIGWVSVITSDVTLMKGFLSYAKPKVIDPKDVVKTFIVVADRCAQRAAPSKEAAMVGALKKGETIKGKVISEDGNDWLTFEGLSSAKAKMTKYMMIDGASVGLGMLLEEQVPQKASTWKVVFDRVAKRETPDKEGKMITAALKGEEYKGTVVKTGEVEWLCFKEGKQTAYMMIDGASVDLGILLEKVVKGEKADEKEEEKDGEKAEAAAEA